jgi:hypothetical protein
MARQSDPAFAPGSGKWLPSAPLCFRIDLWKVKKSKGGFKFSEFWCLVFRIPDLSLAFEAQVWKMLATRFSYFSYRPLGGQAIRFIRREIFGIFVKIDNPIAGFATKTKKKFLISDRGNRCPS